MIFCTWAHMTFPQNNVSELQRDCHSFNRFGKYPKASCFPLFHVSSVNITRKLKRGVNQEGGVDGWGGDVQLATDRPLHFVQSSTFSPASTTPEKMSRSLNLVSTWELRRCSTSSSFSSPLPCPSVPAARLTAALKIRSLKTRALPPIWRSFPLYGSMSGSFLISQRILQDQPKYTLPPKGS